MSHTKTIRRRSEPNKSTGMRSQCSSQPHVEPSVSAPRWSVPRPAPAPRARPPCRYGRILAPHAEWRPLVIPPPSPEATAAPGAQDTCHALARRCRTPARWLVPQKPCRAWPTRRRDRRRDRYPESQQRPPPQPPLPQPLPRPRLRPRRRRQGPGISSRAWPRHRATRRARKPATRRQPLRGLGPARPAPAPRALRARPLPILIVLDPDERAIAKSALCASSHGFNLQAATRVAANSRISVADSGETARPGSCRTREGFFAAAEPPSNRLRPESQR
jgi:hypothetical protein